MYPSCTKPGECRLAHPPVPVKACLDHPLGEETGDQRVRCFPLLAGKVYALLQKKENARPNHCSPHLSSMRWLLVTITVTAAVTAGFSLWGSVDYRA